MCLGFLNLCDSFSPNSDGVLRKKQTQVAKEREKVFKSPHVSLVLSIVLSGSFVDRETLVCLSLVVEKVRFPTMADRIHPSDSPSIDRIPTKKSKNPEIPSTSTSQLSGKLASPSGTYIVQIPKDQILRVPPPENAHRFQKYRRRKNNRNCCCCCLCWILGLIALLLFLIAIAAGIFYLVVRPKLPDYSVENISIKGFNITASNLIVSPEFNVTVRAENPNKKIGIYYEKRSSVTVSHPDVQLSTGVLPVFYQPSKNVTIFQTVLTGSGIRLSTQVFKAITNEESKKNIPLILNLKVPIKVKVGSVKSWTITVKVDCDIFVDKLTEDSRVGSKTCDVKVKPWRD